MHRRVTNQGRIGIHQCLGVAKHDIRRPFALLDPPVVTFFARVVVRPHPCRMEHRQQPVQFPRPVHTQLLIHQPLGRRHVLDPWEAILPTLVTDPSRVQLTRQPFTAVDAHLNRHGKPRLQPRVTEPPHRMNPVEVIMRTLLQSALKHQLLPLTVTTDPDRPARLHRVQHADQTLLNPVRRSNRPRTILLALRGALQVRDRTTRRPRHPFRRPSNAIRERLPERSELLQKNPPRRQILTQTFRVARPSQTPPKPDPIESAQHAADTISISVYNGLHALLLEKDDGLLTNHLTRSSNTLLLPPFGSGPRPR